MLPVQFIGQNIHFAVSLFAALVFFAVFWLYFDAWASKPQKHIKDILGWAGFLLVSLSFVFWATVIEQSVLGRSIFGSSTEHLANLTRLAGFVLIIFGQILDPLQEKPKLKGLESELSGQPPIARAPAVAATGSFGSLYLLPVAALAIAVLYWRRATTGLERHLKPIAIAFGLFFLFELASLGGLLRGTDNPNTYDLVKSFGPLWAVSHLLLLAGSLVLGRWVWRYLTERFISQLFMLFTASILVIFLITTVSFTSLLMRNVQNSSLDNLQTAANVLNYALDSKKAQTQANAQIVAQDPAVAKAIAAKDHKALVTLTSDFLQSKQQSALDITDSAGQVLLRADDPERWGDSLSSDTLVRRALIGKNSSSVTTSEGVVSPQVYIKSTVPVRSADGSIIGTASVSLIANNALVDGIKSGTGLDSSIYSGDELAATTFVAPDGKSRLAGVKINNQAVGETVLRKGKPYRGSLSILNRQFLAAYVPLKDADNAVVGMLFIGQPQTSLLQTAGRSIELTFLIAASLMVLAIAPAYFMARYLARQLE